MGTETYRTVVGASLEPDAMSEEDARALAHVLASRGSHRRSLLSVRHPRQSRVVLLGTAAAIACTAGGLLLVQAVADGGQHSALTAGPVTTPKRPHTGSTRSTVPPSTKSHGFFGNQQLVPVGHDPFITGGESSSFAAASSSASGAPGSVAFAAVQAHSALANPSLLSDVWVGPGGAVEGATGSAGGVGVVLDYVSTGIRISEAPIQQGAPVTTSAQLAGFASEASDLGLPASSVQTVDGVPALILPSQGRGPTINLFVGGATIIVEGSPTTSTSDLIAVANSLS